MAFINWTAEQFGTNVGFADEEHKVVFDKLNKLYDLTCAGTDRDAIAAQLDDLVTYTAGHLAHEEVEMQVKGFAGLQPHKQEHESLLYICTDVQTKVRAGEMDMSEEICILIKSWFESHIPEFDRAYSAALGG